MKWPGKSKLLATSPRDTWTLEDAFAGVLIEGDSGSGKTSGPFRYVVRALLNVGSGGLFLCAKANSTADYLSGFIPHHRKADLVLFGPDHPARFNVLQHEKDRLPPEADKTLFVDNSTSLLLDVIEILSRSTGIEDKFFSRAMEELLKVLLTLMLFSGSKLTLGSLNELYLSLPLDAGEFKDPSREVVALLNAAKRNVAGTQYQEAVRTAERYLRDRWVPMADETRSSISMTLGVALNNLTTGVMKDLFGTGTNVTPQDVLAGKILIVDMPTASYRVLGKITAVMWKEVMQLAILDRPEMRNGTPTDQIRPVFIAADEAQEFVSSASAKLISDSHFASLSRQARGTTVYAIHSIASLESEMSRKGETEVLLANLRTKFICATSDQTTRTWMRNQIGPDLVKQGNFEKELLTLRQGGPKVGVVDAICFIAQRNFAINQMPFWRTSFRQELPLDWLTKLLQYLFTSNVRILAPIRRG